ncbi:MULTISPECIES: tetratricopeptide repeat protein [unclassified Caballeronia]|uniref:tetratricopeptide repeat protein n=1 Tax=unclassified Caballeronia TaxID=2646786 RepID=UPI002855AB12|nr:MULTISPECIES: tetratricopeptide repeat protein [unclassified Caballeronia]MDR5740367.1 tetratricopeptide repeat protein [Caballeronia sp. LZ016]MDR5808453.1 tetratricopeptide repeat protein [Caballeronia sp. LZ019]
MIAFWLIAAVMVLAALGCVVTPLLGRERAHAALAALLIALLPSAAMTMYMHIGNPAALAVYSGDTAGIDKHGESPGSIEVMVSRLAARMSRTPDDAKGWTMLARSYAVLERPADAAAAYRRALALTPRDPDLLADYADALASARGGDLSGEPLTNIDAALAIDPGHPKALALAASAAFDRRDYPLAIRHWEALRDVSGAEPEIARQAQKNIDETLLTMRKRR